MTQVLTAAEARLLLGGKKASPAARAERKPPAPPKESSPQIEARTAQIQATLGQPGVQVWNGVDGQGSVLRFFDLSPTDKKALLDLAAERGIHPTRR